MKRLFRRFVAYMIDMLVVLIISQSLSGLPFINKELEEYKKYTLEYYNTYEEYAYLKSYLSDEEEKELVEEDYNKMLEETPLYKEVVDDIYNKNNKEDTKSKLDTLYEEKAKEAFYNLEKKSTVNNIIYLVTVILYFIFFNLYTEGQTLGKKMIRLKIVNNKDDGKVKWWQYLVRCLILYQPIYYLVRLVCIYFLATNSYFEVVNIVYSIQGYLEMLIIALMVFRIDNRGPQDLLASTRVMMYDRYGCEVEDKSDLLYKNILKSNSKIIDEES